MRTAGRAPPPTLHLAHALHLRQLLRDDRIGHVVQPAQGQNVDSSAKLHDRRIGGIDFSVSSAGVGRFGRAIGPTRALMAACTSRAAASMLRSRSNCSVMTGVPEPARRSHLRDARDAAELPFERRRDRRSHRSPGLRPADAAFTWIVGKSTSGNGATGRRHVTDRAGNQHGRSSAAMSQPVS